jgi:hypothetical protein
VIDADQGEIRIETLAYGESAFVPVAVRTLPRCA